MLEVLEPGLLTTVQDAGRPGLGHLGVPCGGAADPWSLAIANVLVGNDPGAAALETTILGPTLAVRESVTLAIAGADLGARLDPGDVPVPPGRTVAVRAGLRFVLAGPPAAGSGARAYVAVAGGVDVPPVLGSRSTCLAGGFGGLGGRALRSGDLVPTGRPSVPAYDAWPGTAIAPRRLDREGSLAVRVLPGLEPDVLQRLADARWLVAPASDRMGLRLDPADGPPPPSSARHVTSHGVVRGAVQLPPDGRPIILLADHQPTGGYPVVAVVISADLPSIGQLAPGDAVRLVPVTMAEAQTALRVQRDGWEAAMRTLGADRTWTELWQSAGG